MNERIYDLAQKSGWDISEIMNIQNAQKMQMFAELIVEECLDIVGAGGEFCSRPKLLEKIREHFGVEE
jgi:2,4-dienoyl-CoA reductase-like NADH-dependent reductase (Old Yellow Enzyme family)